MALYVAAGCLGLFVGIYLLLPEKLIPAVFGFAFGYIVQRSRFCFAGAFRDIFLIRNTALARSLLLALFLTTLGLTLVHFLTLRDLASGGLVFPVGTHTLAGGVVFGFAMVISGNCVSGCLVRMGEGYLMQWLTFAGLLAGSAAGAWHLGWWEQNFIQSSPVVFLPRLLGWPLALAAQGSLIVLLYLSALKIENLKFSLPILGFCQTKPGLFLRTDNRSWPYPVGAAAISLANTLLFFFLGRPVGVSGGVTHFAGWLASVFGLRSSEWAYFSTFRYREGAELFLDNPLTYLCAFMIIGSLTACLRQREFRLRRLRSPKFAYAALGGGTLMGYSARVALNCSTGGFYSGTSSLSLHGWAFGAALLAGAYLGSKFFKRYLI